jgi:predicted RNA-binding Zn-ribbon protein involved in translation (DUF1610 family)
VCGAEVLVIAESHGRFEPHCCNVPMALMRRKALFFVCPVCGAEVVSLPARGNGFRPRCCNVAMEPAARAAG